MITHYEIHYKVIRYNGDRRRKYDTKFEYKVWTIWEELEFDTLQEAEKEFVAAKKYLIKDNKMLGLRIVRKSFEILKEETAE